MRPSSLFVVVLGGCNLLTDYDTGFLPGPVDAAAGLDASTVDAALDASVDGGAVLDPAPCELVFAATPNDASAPRGAFPAVAPFADGISVAYAGPLEPDDGWSRLQVRFGSCEALDGDTVNLEEVGDACLPVSQPDAAWNPVSETLGVAWLQGEENHEARWRSIAVDLELSPIRYLQPVYEAGTYDLRWPRVSVTDGEWIVLLPDSVAPARATTVYRFPVAPWPPDLDILDFRWPGDQDDYLAAGVADIAGRSATSEYHVAMGVGRLATLHSAHLVVADGMVRGSDPLLAGVTGARVAAVDDVLPPVWTAAEAAPAAIAALGAAGALDLLYPDKSTAPQPIDGATNVSAYDVVAIGSLLVVTWAEVVDASVTEVRLAVADLRDGEIVWQSRSKSIASSSHGGVHGLSATTLPESGRVAISWAEPDQAGFDRVRAACVVCTPP